MDASVSNPVLSISVFGEVEDMLIDSEGLACPLKAIRFRVHTGFSLMLSTHIFSTQGAVMSLFVYSPCYSTAVFGFKEVYYFYRFV